TALLSTIAAPSATLAQDELALAVNAAAAALAQHSDGFSLDDAPEAAEELAALWGAASRWVVDYLDRHPLATAAEIGAAAGALAGDLQIAAFDLADKTVLVSVRQGEIGTVFVVAAHDGRSVRQWSITDPVGIAPAM